MFIIAKIVNKSYRAAYEKFLATKNTKDTKNGRAACPHAAESGRAALVAAADVSFDLPQGWAWVRLRDLGTFTGGHTPSTFNRDLWGDEVLWVTSKDMKSKYINDTILKLTQLGAAELTMLKPNSIIMCTRSGILRRTFPVAIATQHLTINQDQRALTLYIPEMAEYIYDVLKAFESVILAHYKKAGTTVESIIWNKFTEIPIPMPPLPEQRRIVAKIEELFAIADSLGEAADNLESVAKRLDKKILDLAIRGNLVPQEQTDDPASELVKLIAASHKSPSKNQSEPIDPPFETPDSWEWVRLGEICEYYLGKTPPRADPRYWHPAEMPWVTISDMVQYGHVERTKEGISEYAIKNGSAGRISPKGTLLMSFKLTIGKVSILDCDAAHNEAIISILPYEIVSREIRDYLFFTLPILSANAQTSPAIMGDTLNKKTLGNIAIPLPPLAEQKRIVAKIEELRAIIKSLTT